MTTAICSYENIRQITSRTVCNRTFKDPRILPRGHTFCIWLYTKYNAWHNYYDMS